MNHIAAAIVFSVMTWMLEKQPDSAFKGHEVVGLVFVLMWVWSFLAALV
jgi:hypothetical protein